MQFVIDNNANTLKGLMMTSGRSLTVYYYHGNDGLSARRYHSRRKKQLLGFCQYRFHADRHRHCKRELNRKYAFPRYTSGTDGNQARFRQRNQRLQGSGHQPAHFRYLCVWLRRLSARGDDHCKTIECTLCDFMNNDVSLRTFYCQT